MEREFLVGYDLGFTLKEWKAKIEKMIEEHGEDAILYADAGYNNVQFLVKVSNEI